MKFPLRSPLPSDKPSAFVVFGFVLALLFFLGLATWLVACLAAEIWLDMRVPLTPQDLEWASWLISHSTASYFSRVLATTFGPVIALMGVVMALARGSVLPLIPALIISSCFIFFHDDMHSARVGIAEGTVKIGCYVWESKECAEMLGVPRSDARSMYSSTIDKSSGKVDTQIAEWYANALQKVETPGTGAFVFASLPGAYFLMSPLYAFDTGALNAKIEAQRQAVFTYQARHRTTSGPQESLALRLADTISLPADTAPTRGN